VTTGRTSRQLNGGRTLSGNWYYGNAADDGQDTRGWVLGAFIDPSKGVRSSKDVEVKWGIHPLGDKRAAWTADDQRTTMVLLIEGTFRVDLTTGSIIMERQGDYIVWGPGIDHSWEALAPSTVITVRWPSVLSCPDTAGSPGFRGREDTAQHAPGMPGV